MAESFECSLVTPERSVFDGAVVYANLPAHDGQLGILHNHAPLLVQLGPGTFDIELPGGQHRRFEITGGFAQMNHNKLTLLSESAAEQGAAAATAE